MYLGGSQGFSLHFQTRVTRLGRFFNPGVLKKIILPFGDLVSLAGGGFWLREFGVTGLVLAKV